MRKNDEMPFKQWYLRDKQSPFLYKKIRELRKLKSKKKLYSTLLNIRPMKKVVIMTLIALLGSATSFAQSEKDVDPSTPTPEQVVKARRQEAKLAKSLIEQKATKDAKKQAKLLKKQGWKSAPGTLSLEKQLTELYILEHTYDGNFPKYIIGRSSASSSSAALARKQALTRARVDVASQIKLEVAALTEETDTNIELSSGEVETIAKMVDSSQTMLQQSLGRTEVVFDIIREMNGKTEERVAVSYSGSQAKSLLLNIFDSEEMKQKVLEMLGN